MVDGIAAGRDITILEAELVSPPDDPHHYPPSLIWLQTPAKRPCRATAALSPAVIELFLPVAHLVGMRGKEITMRARVGAAAMIAGVLSVTGAARAGATGDRAIDRLDFTTASTPYNLPPGGPPGRAYAITVQCPGDRVPFDARISGEGSSSAGPTRARPRRF